MTWSEIKQAVEAAGIKEEDDICTIPCAIPKPLRRRRRFAGVKFKWTHCVTALVFMFACGAIRQASAQQTIFNVPSSDVLDKGKVYFELDATFKPNKDP